MAIKGTAPLNCCAKSFPRHRSTSRRRVRRRAPAVRSSMTTPSWCSIAYGDIGASAGGPDGLFHCDTRFLSHLEVLLEGMQPLLLGSNVRDDNSSLTVDLTNPDVYLDNRLVLPKDTLHVVRTMFLWRDTAYQRLAIRNHGDRRSICVSPCCSTAISPICSRCAACGGSVEERSAAAASGHRRQS